MDNQIFVKIEEYDQVLKTVNLVKDKIGKAEEIIGKITELKSQEEEELNNWSANLEIVKEKVSGIENELAQSKKA